jgi:signal transduction histidine kinase
VKANSEYAAAMLTRMQAGIERDKAGWARELHDELGGLLLAALMDVSVLEKRIASLADDSSQKLARLKHTVAKAVDITRRMTEELRPTLLDTFGLFTALRWCFQNYCERHAVACTIEVPESEIRLNAPTSIALFRVAEEAFGIGFNHPSVARVHFVARIDGALLILEIADDGRRAFSGGASAKEPEALASLQHRVLALGGDMTIRSPASRGTILTVNIPLNDSSLVH